MKRRKQRETSRELREREDEPNGRMRLVNLSVPSPVPSFSFYLIFFSSSFEREAVRVISGTSWGERVSFFFSFSFPCLLKS